MKDISHIPPATAAPGAFVADTIDRYLDGLTTPAEEQQLLSVLETREAQGTILNDDERAALALLRLTFPEEDTVALLTEDCSIEYEELSGANKQASARLAGSGHQSRSRNALALRGHIRRIAATVATVAAVLALVLMTVIGKRNREDVLTAQTSQSSSRTNHAPSALDERAAPSSALQAPSPAYSPPTVPVSEGTVAFENGRKQPSKHSTPSLTGRAVGESVGTVSAENKPMTPSLPKEDAVTPAYEDPDGAAILATEQQRILEVEQAARQRAIAVTQENTLACVTAASPS
ncbi:MAG: hypothetical protein IJJ94_03945 [Bacteroidaceae bacterium]|nr:hypothetical protein [Bacteroidaceae bacterium]